MNRKKKNALYALILLAVVGLIGGTFAYFTSEDTFANIFRTKPYKMEVTETFESPDDWTPGTTTNKTIIAKNTGDVDAAVRVSYTEKWVDSNNADLPLESGGKRAAIINFASDLDTKWTKDGNYYYYKTKLTTGQSTSSFIESVTFNKDVDITANTSCTEDAVAHTKTCTTSTTGYGGGTYTLTIKVETVQFDQYKAAWSTNVTIS